MSATWDILRDIREACLQQRHLSEEQLQWLGKSLDAFLSHRCETLRQAFGIQQDRGGVPWWLEGAMRQRDRALRQLSERFFPDLSITGKSKAIENLARRYAASAWRFDREKLEMPTAYHDTVREYLWQAFKSGAHMPVSERHLRNLLVP